MRQLKVEFSEQFVKSLKDFYGGRIPSFATVARDFSLRAPHLPHVSAETVRQWARGAVVPHVSRMQVLVDWLGPELAASFDRHSKVSLTGKPDDQGQPLGNGFNAPHTHHARSVPDEQHLLQLMHSLSIEEQQAVIEIAELLAVKRASDLLQAIPAKQISASTGSTKPHNGEDK